jgi:hypothetical protein
MASTTRVLIVLLLLFIPIGLFAQARLTAADIEGTVTDESGAVLPGVTITATNTATNQTRSVVTGKDGRYYIGALQPGTYTLSAELAGFVPQKHNEFRVRIGQLADVHFTLKPGTSEAIVVSARAPVVDITQTSVSSVVDQEQIDSLPTNGRNYLSFTVITPGVTTDRTPQQGASATSGLSFGGQRARSNNIMVDGVDNNDPVVGAVRATFSMEAIQEFQVLTNSYSAEFGKASGGVVNIITRSGTNETRGNVFEFFRDESLNEKGRFEKFDVFGNKITQDKAPFHQNQFGATLGGPIVRDKTFYFASAENLSTDASNFVTIDPAAAAILNANGFPVELGNVPYTVRSKQFLAKIDHQWSPAHSLVLRGNYASLNNQNIEPFGGIVARSRGAEQDRKDWALAASQTDVMSQKWINELRGQYAKEDQLIESLDPNCGGPCGSDNFKGGPTLEITGVASVGRQRFTPQPRHNQRYQLKDTVSFFTGNHSAKAGFDYNYIHTSNTALPLHFGGRYIFAALPAIPALGINAPLSSLQALAAGLPAAYVQGYGVTGDDYDDYDAAVFVQDDWAVTNKLMVKAGLRYQRQWMYDIPYTVSIPGGKYTYKIPDDTNNYGPRLSVAYDPAGNGKSSLHAAWGIFFDNQILANAQVGAGINGVTLRTLVQRIPASITAWKQPGHKLAEPTTPYPSLVISPDPGLQTPYSRQMAVGYDRAFGQSFSASLDGVWVRGKNQIGTIDYNPVVPSLGAGRRPNDVNNVAGTSASVLQYTSFGETWYHGLTLSLNKRFSNNYQYLLSYTYSKAEDTSTDFQSAFITMNNGRGRDLNNLTGLPVGFDPSLERGAATQDQRHRLVLSGMYQFPWQVQFSSIMTVASGRPYTPLAGVDLNGDADGGAFPSDRARTNPADANTSVRRNSQHMNSQFIVDTRLSKRFTLGGSRSVDAIVDVFNLLNRANYTEINNIFGTGSFPNNPLKDAAGRVTYGRYTEALPGRQIQLAAKVSF